MKFKDMKTKELKEIASAYWNAINSYDCFGISDLRNLDGAERELYNRGITMHERRTIEFKEEEVEL